MFKLVYTSNENMLHHINEEVDLHIGYYLLAINKFGKGFLTSPIVDSARLDHAGVIYKTTNSVYIFAYVNDIEVCDHAAFYNELALDSFKEE